MNISNILENLKEIAKLKTDKELADLLILKSASSISNMKKGDQEIPFDKIISLCNEKGWSPNWIFWNEGPKTRREIKDSFIEGKKVTKLTRSLEAGESAIKALLSRLKEKNSPEGELIKIGDNTKSKDEGGSP